MNLIRASVAAAAIAAMAVAALLAAGVPGGASDQATPPDVRAAAEGGLNKFGLGSARGSGSAKGLDRLGFRSTAEIAGATVGDGFQVYLVDPERLLATGASTFDAVIDASTLWQFLVKDGNTPKALLTVDRVNGTWTAVSLGAAGLAEQLTALMIRWPVPTYQLRLIRSHQAVTDVMEIAQGGRVLGAVPFTSGRVALGEGGPFDPNDLWPVERVLTRMKPVVRAALGRQ